MEPENTYKGERVVKDDMSQLKYRLLASGVAGLSVILPFPGMLVFGAWASLDTFDLVRWPPVGFMCGSLGCLLYTLYRWSRRPARGMDAVRILCCGLLGASGGAAYAASPFNPTHELILEQVPWLVWLTVAGLVISGAGLVITTSVGRRGQSSQPSP